MAVRQYSDGFPAASITVSRLLRLHPGGFPGSWEIGFSSIVLLMGRHRTRGVRRPRNSCTLLMFCYTGRPSGGAVSDQRGSKTPLPSRSQSVREDWVACLPQEKARLFEAVLGELETSYTMLSVALNEAFLLRSQGSISQAREEAGISADLFGRSAGRLLHMLRTMHEYGRHLGQLPNVAPLVPENFRGFTSQRLARTSGILCTVLFSSRSRFFHKLHTLSEAAEPAPVQFRAMAGVVPDGSSIA